MTHVAMRDDPSAAEEVEMVARRRTYPLTEFQRSMLEVQLCQPNTCVVNLPLVCSMPRESTDVDRLVQAMRQAVDHHPVFRTILEFDGQGCIVQRYDASLPYEIPVAEVTDEEFEALRGSLKVMRRTSLQVSLFEQGMLFKSIYARNLYDESHVLAFKGALKRRIDRLVQF